MGSNPTTSAFFLVRFDNFPQIAKNVVLKVIIEKTGNSILQFHHKDGNSNNNSPENIQVLCPNCHAMTENYMALNKGHSARDKRYK